METIDSAVPDGMSAPGMCARPAPEHQWLQKLVGDWTFESEATMDGSACHSSGKESVRSLGGLWVLAEGQGEMPGGLPAATLMSLGYDPQKGRFVGAWIGSMMSHLWIYDGELDAATDVLTLNAEGPAMSGSGTARYQDTIQFHSDDHRTLCSRVERADGHWDSFQVAHYRRTR